MIIALSGYAQSGKDTTADILVREFGFTRIAFADKLKEVAHRLHYWNGSKDDIGRLHLQVLGQVLREELGDDVWVRAAFKDHVEVKNYVVSDCRYQNEASFITELGGEIWRVWRPGYTAVNGHISETNLDNWPFDRTIHNTGTTLELRAQVFKIMESKGICRGW